MYTKLKDNKNRKTFVVDTSVLLYDRLSIHTFPNSDVVIPIVVLEELDNFKDRRGILGENARYINRFLDSLRQVGNIHKKIDLENGQTIRVETDFMKKANVPPGLDPNLPDNKIIGVAGELAKNQESKVVVITKDINFRVKCDALGISSEDYYKDHVGEDINNLYTGFSEISFEKDAIDDFFKDDTISLGKKQKENLFENQFIIGRNEDNSMLGIYKDGNIKKISPKLNSLIKVNPRNKEQKFALELLTDPDIQLVTLTGIAGSGKTFLTLMAALSGIQDNNYSRIVITRSMQPVGREIGFLPGDIKEKMDPWMSPIVDNFRCNFKDTTYFEMMCGKNQIEIAPLTFMRGRTFNDSFIIVDEAQNATIHELKTIITRVGEGTKVVLLGDIEQIDTPYIDTFSNGLTIITEKFKNSKIAGHVTLRKGERSELATLASKLI